MYRGKNEYFSQHGQPRTERKKRRQQGSAGADCCALAGNELSDEQDRAIPAHKQVDGDWRNHSRQLKPVLFRYADRY